MACGVPMGTDLEKKKGMNNNFVYQHHKRKRNTK